MRKQDFQRVILQFLVTPGENMKLRFLHWKTWAKEMGVDELQLKTTQIYDFETRFWLDSLRSGLFTIAVPVGNGQWKIKKNLKIKLPGSMWQTASQWVTWGWKVVRVASDKDANS